jgi:hypothetical protein
MTNPAAPADDHPQPVATRRDVLEELHHSARRLATASKLQDRWLLWAGSFLVPTGLLLILLGYRGAAHAPRVIQQIPYQISGGIFGLALVFAGTFSYFAWWLTRVVRQQERLAARIDAQTATLVAELRAIRNSISGAPTESLVPTPPAKRERPRPTRSQSTVSRRARG